MIPPHRRTTFYGVVYIQVTGPLFRARDWVHRRLRVKPARPDCGSRLQLHAPETPTSVTAQPCDEAPPGQRHERAIRQGGLVSPGGWLILLVVTLLETNFLAPNASFVLAILMLLVLASALIAGIVWFVSRRARG